MILEVSHLTGGYGSIDVCRDLSFSLDSGEVLCVLGPNGSGKSTLFRFLLGFLKPRGGDILIKGKNIQSLSPKALSKEIAYIPQYHTPAFAYTVREIVTMGRNSHFSPFSGPGKSDQMEVTKALEQLSLLPLAGQKYHTLSGGQRQLVLIARALCQNASILVMDEPDSGLDYSNQQLILRMIKELAGQGYSIILSTHSPERPFSCADQVLLLKEGQVCAFGSPSEALTGKNLFTVYGIEMDVVSIKDRGGSLHTLCLPVT